MMDKFERLNRETFRYNNGLSRSIDPTAGSNKRSVKDILSDWNNRTYKMNNGAYPDRPY